MKLIKAGAAIALALAIAACDEGGSGQGNGEIAIANPGSDQLKALPPINRRAGLLSAIQRSGIACGTVLTVAYQQQYRNLAMWVALCGNGRHYAVFIAPTDDVQVRDCAEHAQLDLPRCRPTPPLPRDPRDPPSQEPDANIIAAANANLVGE